MGEDDERRLTSGRDGKCFASPTVQELHTGVTALMGVMYSIVFGWGAQRFWMHKQVEVQQEMFLCVRVFICCKADR